jgi:hypothetical protein
VGIRAQSPCCSEAGMMLSRPDGPGAASGPRPFPRCQLLTGCDPSEPLVSLHLTAEQAYNNAAVLQPVAEREPAVGLAGAFVGGRGAIASQHGPGLPTGQPHQVGLAPALGEPLVGEGVP